MRLRGRVLIPLAVVVVAVLLVVNYLRPIPAVAASPALPPAAAQGSPPSLPWPSGGATAAVGATGAGVLAASGPARPTAIYSVAKVMTAIVVLEAKPLKKGVDGPSITVTAADVAVYNQKAAAKESVVLVQAGEQLTELQALQALLIPSGNNIADLLGRWAFGSVDAEVQRMNAKAKEMKLAATNFADPSGADLKTVSTPSDLVRLGEVAMADPVIVDVVALPQVVLPVAGTKFNVNYALGQGGIVGIKTGSSTEGGTAYLFAAPVDLPGVSLFLVGAVVGEQTLDQAFTVAKALIPVVKQNLSLKRVVARDQTVGRYVSPWGSQTDIVAAQDAQLVVWPGSIIRETLAAPPVEAPLAPGSKAGNLELRSGDQVVVVPLVTTSGLFPPGRAWRLTRIG